MSPENQVHMIRLSPKIKQLAAPPQKRRAHDFQAAIEHVIVKDLVAIFAHQNQMEHHVERGIVTGFYYMTQFRGP